jgi:hypothetical protein
METIVGIFHSRADAEHAVQQLYGLGVSNNRIGLLTPGADEKKIGSSIPVTDAEPPGIGKALGATVGGAIGAAGGATMGVALASLLVPGVGPVLAFGLIGAAILGIGGAATGLAAGEALEEGLSEGLPHDELFVYEDALRKGHSVVVAVVPDEEAAEKVRDVLTRTGAESVDAAEENWWLGLRDAEATHYEETGGEFQRDEVSYRSGFKAALHPTRRGKSYADNQQDLNNAYGNDSKSDAFRHGYERGQAYQGNVTEIYKV